MDVTAVDVVTLRSMVHIGTNEQRAATRAATRAVTSAKIVPETLMLLTDWTDDAFTSHTSAT